MITGGNQIGESIHIHPHEIKPDAFSVIKMIVIIITESFKTKSKSFLEFI